MRHNNEHRKMLDIENSFSQTKTMITVNMHEAKSRLSELVRKAEAGEEVYVARGGRPVIKLVPISDRCKRQLGLWQNSLSEQPEGWDEKLPPEAVFPDIFK